LITLLSIRGGYLPSALRRFCTTEMKIRPIFDWWFKNIGEKVKMGIGYRYDEMERAERLSTNFKGIVGKRKTQNKWEDIEWREGWFPLIENKIMHPTIIKWANQSGINFPSDSNCIGCFHKPFQQLRKNLDDNPNKMKWFANQEDICKKLKKEMNYQQIKKQMLQSEFSFGTGAGCNGGYCTD